MPAKTPEEKKPKEEAPKDNSKPSEKAPAAEDKKDNGAQPSKEAAGSNAPNQPQNNKLPEGNQGPKDATQQKADAKKQTGVPDKSPNKDTNSDTDG